MGMVACFAPLDAAAVESLLADPEGMAALFEEDELPGTIDLDKSWHGIHYLLTGSAWEGEGPLAHAVLGGVAMGEDVGYGPARLLTPAQVKAVAEALAPIDEAALRTRFQPAAMEAAEIYPEIWERDGEEGFDYLRHYFGELKQFYADTAARGDGAVLWLC